MRFFFNDDEVSTESLFLCDAGLRDNLDSRGQASDTERLVGLRFGSSIITICFSCSIPLVQFIFIDSSYYYLVFFSVLADCCLFMLSFLLCAR